MTKKLSKILPKKEGYNWQYCSLGGVTRVKIETGQDIAHLGELDRKLWSVLSCPVDGLEFDRRTLELMDSNHDGKLRVDEVIAAAQWITAVLANPDDVLQGADTLRLNSLSDSEVGREAKDACTTILSELERATDTITFKDIDDYKALIDERYAKTDADVDAVDVRPFGDSTDAVTAAANALRDKVADYFMRCNLIRFNAEAKAALDVSVERISSIAAGDVAKASDDIATYPLARPNAEGTLLLDNINPVWASHTDTIRKMALDGADQMTAEQWGEILAKVDAYAEYLTKQADGIVAMRSEEHAAAVARYMLADKLLHMYRDFYTLLRNYVFFKDFYLKDSDTKAIFQAGRLFIDQRCCDLCLKIDSIDAHAATSGASGIYLLYCKCTSREKNETMNIVAALTDGDVDSMVVGKNAVFYDRTGHCWDAVVVKIIDNPISIRQAFWSPYRKFWNWCTDKINKSAAEKEDKAFNDLTAKAETATEEVKTGAAAEAKDSKKQAFDIAKFAGIFAAIGMAIGYIGSALAGITETIGDNPLNLLILICAIILVISGPSMFIAWTKLRKRNLGPLLNANGWAVNAVVLINVRFGATLTSLAKYPKMVLDDPFAEKKMPCWKKWLISILVIAAIAGAILLTCHLAKESVACAGPADSVLVEEPADTAE